jgi:hypothetical protein
MIKSKFFLMALVCLAIIPLLFIGLAVDLRGKIKTPPSLQTMPSFPYPFLLHFHQY